MADLLLGDANSVATGTNSAAVERGKYAGWYAQDQWTLTPSFTVNLGVRYELFFPYVEQYNHMANFIVNPNDPNFGHLVFAGLNGQSRSLLTLDKNNIAPRGGFAWREAPGTGIVIGRNRSPRYLWVAFNGEQPETCAPLAQFVPVTAGANYSLRYEYHTAELPPASGLRWSVSDARTGIDLTAASPWLSSPDWKTDEVRFTAPAAGLVRVALTCQRLQGATRIEGSVALRHVSMERRP